MDTSEPKITPSRWKMDRPRIILTALALVALTALPFLAPDLLPDPGEGTASADIMSTLELPRVSVSRGAEIDPWREAYMAGNYEEVIRVLNERLLDREYRFKAEAYHFLGASYMALEQYEEALSAFEQIDSGSGYFSSSEWYRSMALIHLDQHERARKLLEKIKVALNHPHREEAVSVLEKLD